MRRGVVRRIRRRHDRTPPDPVDATSPSTGVRIRTGRITTDGRRAGPDANGPLDANGPAARDGIATGRILAERTEPGRTGSDATAPYRIEPGGVPRGRAGKAATTGTAGDLAATAGVRRDRPAAHRPGVAGSAERRTAAMRTGADQAAAAPTATDPSAPVDRAGPDAPEAAVREAATDEAAM